MPARPDAEDALLERITVNLAIFGGKPILRGHRLAVEHVLGMLAAGDTPETILAGYPWMEDVVKYVLGLGVPPNKLSLGIPSYSEWWYPTYDAKDGPRMTGGGLTYDAAQGILARNGAKATWDDRQKEGMAYWQNDGINEFLFLVDARSMAARVALAKQYGLRGYSVWVLGFEDPAVWR